MQRKIRFQGDILVGVDLGDDWNNAVAHAAQLAAEVGARVHLVHALEPAASGVMRLLQREELTSARSRAAELARERLEQAEAELPEAVRGEVHLDEGHPVEVVKAAADRLGVGLCAVGVGYTSSGDSLFVGTNTDRLLRGLDIPTLIVGRESPRRFRRVLVPTDLDRGDEAAFRLASDLAATSGAELHALHTTAVPSLLHGYLGDLAELRERLRARAEEQFHSYLDGVERGEGAPEMIRHLVAESDETHPAEVIVAEANRLGADLICMALGGITLLQRWFLGGVAERVLRALPCTLLALPKPWAEKH